MMGDTIGGLLVHPEKRFRAFDTPFWYKYPFALPCMVASVVSSVTGVLGLLTLNEVSTKLYVI